MKYALGIDLGTTKVAAVLSDSGRRVVADSSSVVTHAELKSEQGFAEQNVSKILDAVTNCIRSLNPELRKKVTAIGVTGQMHSVLLWSKSSAQVSSLVTWQDARCTTTGFLPELHKISGDESLRDGYGCSTLAWLAKHRPEFLSSFDSASTIHDYLVNRMTGSEGAFTDPSDAASWGLFDILESSWKIDSAGRAGIPKKFLPDIRPSGSLAGALTREYGLLWGLPEVPVMVALGDNQASIYGTVREQEREIALTLGTGGQISVIIDREAVNQKLPVTAEMRPFVGNKYLIVGASLSGGSAIAWLVHAVQNWCQELKIQAPSEEGIYKKIDQLGRESLPSPLEVISSFNGERHNPSQRGSILNIDLHNFTFGNISAGLIRSIIKNLHEMIPPVFLKGRTRVIGSGNGLRRLSLAQHLTEEIFGLPLILTEGREEAALGAALLAADSVQSH